MQLGAFSISLAVRDLEVFAKKLSQSQRKALGVRRGNKNRRYPSPDQSTFSRLMSKVDVDIVEQVSGLSIIQVIKLNGKRRYLGGADARRDGSIGGR